MSIFNGSIWKGSIWNGGIFNGGIWRSNKLTPIAKAVKSLFSIFNGLEPDSLAVEYLPMNTVREVDLFGGSEVPAQCIRRHGSRLVHNLYGSFNLGGSSDRPICHPFNGATVNNNTSYLGEECTSVTFTDISHTVRFLSGSIWIYADDVGQYLSVSVEVALSRQLNSNEHLHSRIIGNEWGPGSVFTSALSNPLSDTEFKRIRVYDNNCVAIGSRDLTIFPNVALDSPITLYFKNIQIQYKEGYANKTTDTYVSVGRKESDNSGIYRRSLEGWSGSTAKSSQSAAGDVTFSHELTLDYSHRHMFGIHSVNGGNNFNGIHYAIYVADNNVQIYEQGTGVSNTSQAYAAGDVFAVRRIGNEVTYLKNDTVFYTSTIQSTGQVKAAVSFNYSQKIIINTTITQNGSTEYIDWQDLYYVTHVSSHASTNIDALNYFYTSNENTVDGSNIIHEVAGTSLPEGNGIALEGVYSQYLTTTEDLTSAEAVYLGTGNYTCRVKGSGSVSFLSHTATEANPVTFSVTLGQTINFTPSGDVERANVTNTPVFMSFTKLSSVAADNNVSILLADAQIDGTQDVAFQDFITFAHNGDDYPAGNYSLITITVSSGESLLYINNSGQFATFDGANSVAANFVTQADVTYKINLRGKVGGDLSLYIDEVLIGSVDWDGWSLDDKLILGKGMPYLHYHKDFQAIDQTDGAFL